ncbi:MAG: hypothetical protein E4H01_05075 [Lysobacterales bacterium]|nr:MAG: hypothetical protein E4H01_05075 [Xanthomonadales bacterium]
MRTPFVAIASIVLVLGAAVLVSAAPKDQAPLPATTKIIFLHHSTGEVSWNGGVADWFAAFNQSHGTRYLIEERAFPSGDTYPWENYPYDYWNIWVKHAGSSVYRGEPTLEMLSKTYQLVVFKHCFPVSGIEPDGTPAYSVPEKTIANYKLQYTALKTKLRSFPNVRFVVWTGAALIEAETTPEQADRAKRFFDWVKNTWDEPGDNIYVWDFFALETNGGKYFLSAYCAGDSHPNEAFAARVAPLFCQRLVDVIGGKGDTTSITGTAR